MSDYYVGQFVAVRGPLAGLAEGFAEVLWGRGYSPRTVDAQMRMVRDLSGWLEDRGRVLATIDDDIVEVYVSERRRRCQPLRSSRGVAPLLEFLRGQGVVPPASPTRIEGSELLLAEFEAHLFAVRGLGTVTVWFPSTPPPPTSWPSTAPDAPAARSWSDPAAR